MWKLLIADDEPKIRKGLKNILPWDTMGIEVAGEAEDGQQALELAYEIQPNIMFVDINMPFLNGLDLIEQLQNSLKWCVVIVITGHDEFAYAQQAIKLNVFDYILKPVVKSKLEQVVDRAKDTLIQAKQDEEQHHWANLQLKANSTIIRDAFLVKWMDRLVSEEEVERNLKYFKLSFKDRVGMLLLKVMPNLDTGIAQRVWDKDLLEFAAKNVVEDMVRGEGTHAVFNDCRGHIVLLMDAELLTEAEWMQSCVKIQNKLESILEKVVLMDYGIIQPTADEAAEQYKRLASELKAKGGLSPIVLLTKKFIDNNYQNPELSLREVAVGVQVSPTYLSKQLKKELGLSFIDYLTNVRIQKAIQLMSDPTVKVYEIAEWVGYSSQHYFSNAFKRITGSSPLLYRKGNRS